MNSFSTTRKSAIAVVGALMVALLQPAVEASAAPASLSTQAGRSEGRLDERPDRLSAMSTAQLQDSRVEDESQRTPTTATYANPDGSWTTEAYAGVVRAEADPDKWVPVDAEVQKGEKGIQ